jgi:SAM-dependent methyltransferase
VSAKLDRQRRDWETLAAVDPLWAVLTDPARKGGRWTRDEFLASGEDEVAAMLAVADGLGRPASRRLALDFGCGAGRLTRALAARFDEAVGLDIASGMVQAAEELNGDVANVRFEVNTRSDLGPVADDSVDLVYSSLVLQHLPSRALIAGFVREFLRVCAPTGLVVFGLPSQMALVNRLQASRRAFGVLRRVGVSERWLIERTPLTPMRMLWLPEDDVRALLAGAGAELLHSEPQPGSPGSTRYYVAPAAR